MILVTGGAGFIGSNFVIEWLTKTPEPLIVVDKLSYAGNLINLKQVFNNSHFKFKQADINDKNTLLNLFKEHHPRCVINFAAESHVDRSIQYPEVFIKNNVNGTFSLLETAHYYWSTLSHGDQSDFRYLQISTDEVFGSLPQNAAPFTETSAYAPNNPYSASKAAADHLVRAFHQTYGLPTLTINCSNNYGPYQFPEKLIPFTILNALSGKPIPIYGDGLNIRDWIFVLDHCKGIRTVLEKGKVGERYNIGGKNEKTNHEVVTSICSILDEIIPHSPHIPHSSLITFVKDRPGHDRRYAIDTHKIESELGWKPNEDFRMGIFKTVKWYIDNIEWISKIQKSNSQSVERV